MCQVKRCLCLSSPTDNTSLPCTGRGECVCGVCECNDPRYIGDYCECDTLNCDQHDNKLCNGRHSPVSQTLKQTWTSSHLVLIADHGQCMCGVCSCEPGWSGTACECYDDPDACVDPVTGKSCNDQGSCECGKCNCVAPYFGNFCSHCPVSAYYWSTTTKIIFFFYKFNSDYFQGASFVDLQIEMCDLPWLCVVHDSPRPRSELLSTQLQWRHCRRQSQEVPRYCSAVPTRTLTLAGI